MKKKSFSDLGCVDRVKTMQQQEQTSPAQTYRRKARSVVARMRRHHRQAPASDVRPTGLDVAPATPVPPSVSSPSLPSAHLQALVYQVRFSTQAQLRKEALEGLFLASRFSEATIEALESALDDTDAEVREAAAHQIASFPPPLTDTLLDKLIARIWDPDIAVRKAVAASLAHHPDPRALAPLMGLMGTPDDELRYIAHNSLVRITEQLGPPPTRNNGDV